MALPGSPEPLTSTFNCGPDFRAYYLRTTSMFLCTVLTIGVGIQFFLSHLLAPFGSQSRAINAVYAIGFFATLYNVAFATSTEQLTRYVGVPSSVGLSLTRMLRAVSIARGSPNEAASWLNLGRGESRVLVKMAGMLVQGTVLAMVSAGLPQERRVALIATPEALRLGLLVEAAWRAGGTRRIGAAAARQAAFGAIAYCAGVALSWSHEVLVWQLWNHAQTLEVNNAVDRLANAFCSP